MQEQYSQGLFNHPSLQQVRSWKGIGWKGTKCWCVDYQAPSGKYPCPLPFFRYWWFWNSSLCTITKKAGIQQRNSMLVHCLLSPWKTRRPNAQTIHTGHTYRTSLQSSPLQYKLSQKFGPLHATLQVLAVLYACDLERKSRSVKLESNCRLQSFLTSYQDQRYWFLSICIWLNHLSRGNHTNRGLPWKYAVWASTKINRLWQHATFHSNWRINLERKWAQKQWPWREIKGQWSYNSILHHILFFPPLPLKLLTSSFLPVHDVILSPKCMVTSSCSVCTIGYACVCVCVCARACLCVCVCVCMHTCVHVYCRFLFVACVYLLNSSVW